MGRYFNSDGLPTKYFAQVLESVERVKQVENVEMGKVFFLINLFLRTERRRESSS